MKQVIFSCETCDHINRSEFGTEGFEVRQVEFESLTGAQSHLMKNPDHYMVALVQEEQ